MSLRLLKPTNVPPDGFRYVHPQTGYTSHAWDYDSWISDAARHLSVNGFPVPDNLKEIMEEQLCSTLEAGWCSYDAPNRIDTRLTWDDVKSGITTFTKWITQGFGFVEQQEADRRALICSRCYLNVNVQGCSTCHKAAAAIIEKRATKFDNQLRACAVCKCLIRAMVHFRMEDLSKSEHQKELYLQIPYCWLNPTSENYRGDIH